MVEFRENARETADRRGSGSLGGRSLSGTELADLVHCVLDGAR
jgi:hypothetical protein